MGNTTEHRVLLGWRACRLLIGSLRRSHSPPRQPGASSKWSTQSPERRRSRSTIGSGRGSRVPLSKSRSRSTRRLLPSGKHRHHSVVQNQQLFCVVTMKVVRCHIGVGNSWLHLLLVQSWLHRNLNER